MAKGLGRGLDAFFGDEDSTTIEKVTKKKESDGEVIEKVVQLNISKIEPMLNQPRKIFDEEKMKELTDSIRANGVIQPILVVKAQNGYTIVAGERRWRAAKAAGLKSIPAIVKDYTDNRKKQVALIENIQREDLNIVEVAHAIKEIKEMEGYSNSDVARITGKNDSTISNIIRLLKLPDEVQDMMLKGQLVEGQARALLAVDDPNRQIEIAKKTVEKKLTVRDVEKLIYGDDDYRKKKMKKKQPKSVYYQKVENKLKDYFGYKVKLDSTKKHQRLIIEYNDEEGLESILSLFNIDM